MIDHDKVECGQHGEGYEAYVCVHLFENPVQLWHSRDATSDNPWPDSWCAKCDEAFMRDGEWTEDISGCTQIKLICNLCYEKRRVQAVGVEP